jgi:plastocyanin
VLAATSLVAAAAVTDDTAQPGDARVTASGVEFTEQVTMDASSAAGILVSNDDPIRHTFVIDGAVDAVELPADTDVRVEVDLAPGTYRFYCDVTGHENMEGTLVVG